MQRVEDEPFRPSALLTCAACGMKFIFRGERREWGEIRKLPLPKLCPHCRREQKKAREAREREAAEEKRKKDAAVAHALFEKELGEWNVVPMEEAAPHGAETLRILGNGFDLVHRVKSGYPNFRDTLGKHSALRTALETYLTDEDIWADFETSLAHFDLKAMGGSDVVDTLLDIFEAYDEDAQAADFFMAAETAAEPMVTIAEELPKRFAKWVASLTVGTEDRPLACLFGGGKTLNFNYTEFAETLYGVARQDICYLHGCRRKEKCHPAEQLILGHRPGESDRSYDFDDRSIYRRGRRRDLLEAAQEHAIRIVSECDDALTKDSAEIIRAHADFFGQLKGIRRVVVFGHSLSRVDQDYFAEVRARIGADAVWYFGCYGAGDLGRLRELVGSLGLSPQKVAVFRTDGIRTAPMASAACAPAAEPIVPEKQLCKGENCAVSTQDGVLRIREEGQRWEFAFSNAVAGALFLTRERLLVVQFGFDAGVYLFGKREGKWTFFGELESIPNQVLMNVRLRHVFLADGTLTFVYNSRVRQYSTETAELLCNRAVRTAPQKHYEGTDILDRIPRRR